MKPLIALLSCLAFARWLLRKDPTYRARMPGTLWIPLIWLFIYSTRPIAAWLGVAGGGGTDLDGNPIDAVIVFALIGASFFVLRKRGFYLSGLASLNFAF